ncbi:MAG: amidase, partial [Candidatus Marinimicrobia bacterium]|nr:amidase [Candidatus Neomarinimicrobiota bacterium]
NLQFYQKLRSLELQNSVPPALVFNPLPVGFEIPVDQKDIVYSKVDPPTAPSDIEDLAYYSVRELGEMLRTRQITSVDLTKVFLERLKKYDPHLQCAITLTEELAFEQAQQADKEIAAGNYRGILHGVPYGLKDLFAVKGYQTTWGAMPYKDQVIEENATVYNKLQEAGAVLVAKFTLGALAWGDVWFGGQTKNPWNLEEGSSGSSAGSAAAVAAGLVPFAIGTETWGSIVSPGTRTGATGLRPTFGRVSRHGAMALAWSMDKVGPLSRNVEDCAVVFDAIRGADDKDQSIIEAPFNYDATVDIKSLKIGYTESLFEQEYPGREFNLQTLEVFKKHGIELIPVELPDYPVEAQSIILSAEAAAAFDQLTLTGKDSLLVRQIKNAWPNVFRSSRFIPAVEYIQANRARYEVIQQMAEVMKEIDMYIVPSFGGDNLLLTNLTGHPCVVLPNGFEEDGTPVSVSFIGDLFGEAKLLTVAKWYQDQTDFHLKHPPDFQ